jgi:hypothetical protein
VALLAVVAAVLGWSLSALPIASAENLAVHAVSRPMADAPVLVPPGTGSPELERLREALSSTYADPMTAAVGISCWDYVEIRSHGNNLYVAVEQDEFFPDRGVLRARTPGDALGSWERFPVCRNPADWRTVIGSYWRPKERPEEQPDLVCAVFVDTSVWDTGRGLLRTQPCSKDAYSVFTTINPPGSGYSTWFYSVDIGLYVSAQLDYSGTYHASLRSRLGQVGPWEWFTW